jgi:hypothetical protein
MGSRRWDSQSNVIIIIIINIIAIVTIIVSSLTQRHPQIIADKYVATVIAICHRRAIRPWSPPGKT